LQGPHRERIEKLKTIDQIPKFDGTIGRTRFPKARILCPAMKTVFKLDHRRHFRCIAASLQEYCGGSTAEYQDRIKPEEIQNEEKLKTK